MKKTLGILALIFFVALFAAPIFAADEATTVTVFGVTLQVASLDAIVALLAGSVVTVLTQLLKKKISFLSGGVGAFLLTVAMTFGTTALYFLVINPMNPWNTVTYVIYSVAVLGESTGYYHLYSKLSGTTT